MIAGRTPRRIIGEDAYLQLVFEGYEIVPAAALAAKDTALSEMRVELEAAKHELSCCDDIPLDQGLVVGISELQSDREHLRAALEQARKAIEPFAKACPELFNDWCPDETPVWWNDFDDTSVASPVTVGDFRAAARALSSQADGEAK